MTSYSSHHRAGDRAGMTLLEVMISMALIATVLSVSLAASATVLRNERAGRGATVARELACQFLDEITSLPLRDSVDPVFGLESDEIAGDRTTYDDVDDYHLFQSDDLTHRDGETIEGFDDWSISVTVTPVEPTSDGVTILAADDQSPLRQVTIEIDSPTGPPASYAALVSDVPGDRPDGIPYQSWGRFELHFQGSRTVQIPIPLKNRPQEVIP